MMEGLKVELPFPGRIIHLSATQLVDLRFVLCIECGPWNFFLTCCGTNMQRIWTWELLLRDP